MFVLTKCNAKNVYVNTGDIFLRVNVILKLNRVEFNWILKQMNVQVILWFSSLIHLVLTTLYYLSSMFEYYLERIPTCS